MVDTTKDRYWSRRKYLATAGGTSLFAGISGCLGEGNDETPDTLVWMTGESSGEWQAFWNQVASDYQEETGTAVQMEYTGSGADEYERMTTLIQAGNPPAIVHGNHLGAVGILYSEGFLNPIDDVVAEMEEEYGPSSEALKMNPFGTNHMVATECLIYCEWYRNDLYDFEDHTHEEVLSQAPEVDSEEMRATQVAAAPTGVSGANLLTGGCVSGADVVVFDENEEATFVMDEEENREIFIEQLEYMKELHQYGDNGSDCSWGCTSDGYARGSFAHVWYAGGRAGMGATEQNPEHARLSSPKPITSATADSRTPVLPQQYGHGVFSEDVIGEEMVEQAKDLIRFVFLDRDRYLEYLSLTPLHFWPTFGDIAESEDYKNLSPYTENPDTMLQWLETWNSDFMDDIRMGADVGRAFPYYGPTRQTNIPAEIVHEVIIGDADPAEEFDRRMPEMREEFERIKEQIDEEIR